MRDSTLNMSYVNHYLDIICYLQDNCISFFCMSLIPIMIQNIYIMDCSILIYLSRIVFTHGALKLLTIQIRNAAVMAEINLFNHKSSNVIPNEMVC